MEEVLEEFGEDGARDVCENVRVEEYRGVVLDESEGGVGHEVEI